MACLVGGLAILTFLSQLALHQAAPVIPKGGAVRDAVNPAHTFLTRHSEGEIPLKPSISKPDLEMAMFWGRLDPGC